MSVEMIPVLIEEKLLDKEIVRLCKMHPPAVYDSANGDLYFHSELEYDIERGVKQFSFAKLSDCYKHSGYGFESDEIRFQLLCAARNCYSHEASRCANALYTFLGSFLVGWTANVPFNEYGFDKSAIIGPANARRLSALYKKIDFALLRPVYDSACKQFNSGLDYSRIQSLDELIAYTSALHNLLLQSIEENKALYVFVSP